MWDTWLSKDALKLYSAPSTPERLLLLAILERAVCDLKPNVEPKDRRNAIAWFQCKEIRVDNDHISFKEIIDLLELSSAYIKILMDKVYMADHV